jgi:hypothetical protein
VDGLGTERGGARRGIPLRREEEVREGGEGGEGRRWEWVGAMVGARERGGLGVGLVVESEECVVVEEERGQVALSLSEAGGEAFIRFFLFFCLAFFYTTLTLCRETQHNDPCTTTSGRRRGKYKQQSKVEREKKSAPPFLPRFRDDATTTLHATYSYTFVSSSDLLMYSRSMRDEMACCVVPLVSVVVCRKKGSKANAPS